MKQFIFYSLLYLAMCAVVSARELWLIGGGERVCSSVDLPYCEPAKRAEAERYFHERDALFEKSMQFSAEHFSLLTSLPNWAGGEAHKNEILHYLKTKQSELGSGVVSESQWHKVLKDFPGSDDELQLIDDMFEVRVKSRFGHDKKIEVNFDASFTATKNTLRAYLASAQPFAQKKKHTKPVVVIFTASSYNPMEYVD
jgi:hypothetical protein